MLSDTLFEISCTLGKELQEYEYYPAELLSEIVEGWIRLEKIRIRLDRSPDQPELSPEENTELAKLAISPYFRGEYFS